MPDIIVTWSVLNDDKFNSFTLNNILLKEHNKYRKMHTLPNLLLDNELITVVQYKQNLKLKIQILII